MTLEAFFETYGKALTDRDIGAIAACWSVPSLVLGPDGAIPVADRSEVEAFFSQSLGQYDGVATAKARLVGKSELLPGVFACDVQWDHLNAAGETVGAETGYYIVRSSGSNPAIEVYSPTSG